MNTSMHAKRLAAMALAPFFWAAAQSASACVTDNASLANALLVAQFIPQTIQIARGNYDLKGSVWSAGAAITPIQAGTKLLGGYSSDCSSRNIAAGNTVVANSTHGGGDGGEMLGDLTLEGLTFTTALEFSNDRDFGGTDLPVGTALVFRRDVFSSLFVDWGQSDDVDGTIRIVDTLVAGNTQAVGCSVAVQVDSGSPDVDLVNDTIVDNTGTPGSYGAGACFFDLGDGSALLRLFNNILYGNSVADLTSNSPSVILVDNIIGKPNYPTPLFLPLGTLTGDPKLDANYRPIESPPSPAINSGSNDVPGGLPATDLDGGPRVVGSTVDRGAYESAVDDAFILHVTNNNDSGSGSLRQAITNANSNGGFNIIEFAIGTSCGPQVITLQSHLPNITASVLINGYTQPGSSANTLDVGDDAVFCIVLDGGTNTIANGLNVLSGAAWFEGLAFSGFTTAAINLQGGSGHVIEGVRIGGSTGGGALAPVHDGIDVGLAVADVTIGGSDNGKRNIIGDATFNGINIAGGSDAIAPAHDNQIVNNYIGVGWNKNTGNFTNLGNGQIGLRINGRTNTISGNVIGFNFLRGIDLYGSDAHDNAVSGNFIGVSPSGDNLGNSNGGVYITQDAHDNTLSGNTIADNQVDGIGIASGQHNLLRANSIHDNSGIGIDLGADGVTPNDNDSTPPAGDPPNRDQNFPVLTGAIGGDTKGKVSGMLTSTPGDYRIEFFASPACDASGHGPGETYLGHTTITLPNLTVNGQTTVSFNKTVESFFLQIPGEMITATATAQAPGVAGDTSEFSACFPYFDDTIFASGFDQALF